MTSGTSRSSLDKELWARAGGVTYRNLGVEDSETRYPTGFFTQGVELVVDHRVTTAAGYSSSVSQRYTAAGTDRGASRVRDGPAAPRDPFVPGRNGSRDRPNHRLCGGDTDCDLGKGRPIGRLLDAASEQPQQKTVRVEPEQVGETQGHFARVGSQPLVAVQ